MGQEYSKPQPGAKLRVIGAGLPRTGTASTTRALEILLNGPVYHGGTQVTLGPEKNVKGWIKLLSQWPPRDEETNQENLSIIQNQMDGYVAVTDAPCNMLVPELLTLYPEAKVICTTRDVEAWEKSMDAVASASTQWFLKAVLFPLPSLRFFVNYIDGLRDQWLHSFGETEPVTRKAYHRHIERLKKVVPKDRLVFLDLRDGWEPLCRALDLPVPTDVPFPRINDSEAMDSFAKYHVGRGIKRWMMIFAVVGGAAAAAMALAKRS